MSAVIDGNTYDIYGFQINGKPSDDTRQVLVTQNTLAESSRTVVTTHKKRFTIAIQNITKTARDQIETTFDKNSFVATFSPYDSTNYTVKVIEYGNITYRPNSTTLFDWQGIVLEVV